MPTFSYQAKQGPTQLVEGTIEAPSQDEAVARLLRGGLVPVVILITSDDLGGASAGARRWRVGAKDRRMFTSQLASLLRAKVELVPAVSILRDQSASRSLRALLAHLEEYLRDGNEFSAALARYPGVFPPLLLSAIRAGEAAGKLDDILGKLVEFDQQQEEFESQLRSALVYPILLFVIGLGCIGFFIWGVVPRMSSLFTQLGGALPWPTRLVVALSGWLTRDWPWVLGAVMAGGLLLRRVAQTDVARAGQERLLRLIPPTRDVLDARQIGRFARTLQFLLESGLPVFQAIDVARPTLGSRWREVRVQAAQEQVKQGASIAESLRAAGCFPPLVTHLIAVGESAGTLVDVLGEVATYYERNLNESLRVATSVAEPLMIVLMGALVGFCVLAMVLPIFEMTQLAR